MKSFSKIAAQGEITIRRIGDLPKARVARPGYKPLALEGGRYVIGHSETGHHHVLSRNDGVEVVVLDQPPQGTRILYAIIENPTSLDHLREHDKHESLLLEPGEYEFRIAREYDPYEQMARQATD